MVSTVIEKLYDEFGINYYYMFAVSIYMTMYPFRNRFD